MPVDGCSSARQRGTTDPVQAVAGVVIIATMINLVAGLSK